MFDLVEESDGVTGLFCYSLSDDGPFRGRFISRGEAAIAAQTDLENEYEFGEPCVYYVGECCHPMDLIGRCDTRLGENIFETVDMWCGDETGAEEWSLSLTKADLDALGRLALSFIRAESKVQWYGVKEVVEYSCFAGFEDFCFGVGAAVRAELELWLASRRAV